MQRRQSAHLSVSHVPRMETKEGKAGRELRPGTGLNAPGYRGKWGVFLSLRQSEKAISEGLRTELGPSWWQRGDPTNMWCWWAWWKQVSVAAVGEARPQRQAAVCVKGPGFCVVRTHSQVLNSSDMMWFQLEKELCAVSEEGISLTAFARIRLTRVPDGPTSVSPVLGDSGFALWHHFSDGSKKSRWFLSWSNFPPAV